jgi:hypothetical protein
VDLGGLVHPFQPLVDPPDFAPRIVR